jgi:hypothetical protein
MSSNNLCKRESKSFNAKVALDADRLGNIIKRAAWLQLIQKPQTLLCKRRGEDVVLNIGKTM